MNKKFLLLLLIIFCSSLYSQDWNSSRLDSLFNLYVKLHNHSYIQGPEEETPAVKCGFGIAAEVFTHFKEFTDSQQRLLKILFSRPVTETSIVSPSGFFRIHFNTTAFPVPAYDVNQFAAALDSAYNFEVNFLGFPPPPPDTQGGISPDSVGGDGKYDIYIVDLPGLYGETDFETEISPDKYTSYMRVHYSFGSGFYTHGIDAARVTAAHEFHHSIQIGDYIYRDNDQFFYELTSTSMEEFVFNTVNDYYGYMHSYFDHPDRAFASYEGYELAIWNIFLKNLFGFGIIKRQWDLMPTKRAIDAINNSLLEHQSSFGKELNTFGIWTYFTDYRAKPGKYFSEGSNYPLINTHNLEINTPLNFTSIKPTSNNALMAVTVNTQDTLAVVLTNSDYLSGINNITKNYSATYNLFDYSSPGSTRLDSNYYEQLTVEDATFWLTSVILNGNLIKQDSTLFPPVAGALDYAYPNPFKYNSNSANTISIPVKAPVNTEVVLYIYSSSMDLIFDKSLQVNLGKDYATVVKWNLDEVGKKLSSGVYIYVTKTSKGKTVGKLLILND
ncbi:MAG TPA: MXAN_6640 family putative metalloprotease [Ignavibacteriaceae bacterium]|nr:MXAN_6640 family putative metalloprotease [Ignavibacteriaceae bacterium]